MTSNKLKSIDIKNNTCYIRIYIKHIYKIYIRYLYIYIYIYIYIYLYK